MDYSLVNKYLEGKAPESEAQELFEWIDLAEENKEEFIKYRKIWALTSGSQEDTKKVWNDFLVRKIRRRRQIYVVAGYLRYAAITFFLIGLGACLQYLLSGRGMSDFSYRADTRIEVPAGQMSRVILPDGSTVHLNSGTTLRYSANFNGGKRTVFLEGEAFFSVAKDKSHPFLVKTGFFDFKVYGTSFNIQTYPGDQEVNATLIEGSLGILDKDGKEYSRLRPSENMCFHPDTKEMTIEKVNTNLYASWKQGLITFNNEKLEKIALMLERWYNVEIIFKNKKLANKTYMGTIMKNKPIDQILNVFRLTSLLNYRIVPRANKPTLIYLE